MDLTNTKADLIDLTSVSMNLNEENFPKSIKMERRQDLDLAKLCALQLDLAPLSLSLCVCVCGGRGEGEGRQHQRVDWPRMEYHTTESREPRGVEEAGCKILQGTAQLVTGPVGNRPR